MNFSSSRFLAVPLSVLLSSVAWSQTPVSTDATSTPTAVLSLSERVAAGFSRVTDEARWSRGMLITAMTQDAQGRLYVASEDAGVWQRDTSDAWKSLTLSNAVLNSEMITAMTMDARGRLWVGTAHSGVAVWNGREWRNFGVLEGAGGEHVFDIAVAPNGEVWIATNEGLARYNSTTDKWRLDVSSGDVSLKNVQAIAFTARGNAVLGTHADGVLVGKRNKDNEYSFRQTRALSDIAPNAPNGSGLPSNMINDVLVTRHGIYAATMCGVSWSRDGGKNWNYIRGRDYAAKVDARNQLKLDVAAAQTKTATSYSLRGASSARAPQIEIVSPVALRQTLLREDAANCLATDNQGRVYIGYRGKSGYEVFDRDFTRRFYDGASDIPNANKGVNAPGGYVSAILPTQSGEVWLGTYGNGFLKASVRATPHRVASSPRSAALPSPMAAPTLTELNAMLQRLAQVSEDAKQPPVVALSDDWATRGEWLGRYGRYWANLAAMLGPEYAYNFIYRAGERDVANRNGNGNNPRESMRYYVDTLYTDKPDALEMPSIFTDSRVKKGYTTWDKNRRQSEMNDYTDVYKPFEEGLNTYHTLQVPPGRFVMSIYCNNKDGAWWDNRLRDFRVSVRPKNPIFGSDLDVKNFECEPELARGRIHNFRNGVWKRFLVQGPQNLTVSLNRNYGFMVTMNALTLDSVDEMPAPYFNSWTRQRVLDEESQLTAAYKDAHRNPSTAFERARTQREAIMRLWLELGTMRDTNATWTMTNARPYYIALANASQNDRALRDLSAQANDMIAADAFYHLRLFSQLENLQRAIGFTPARDIEKSLRWDGTTDKIDARRAIEEYRRRNKINGYGNEEIADDAPYFAVD